MYATKYEFHVKLLNGAVAQIARALARIIVDPGRHTYRCSYYTAPGPECR